MFREFALLYLEICERKPKRLAGFFGVGTQKLTNLFGRVIFFYIQFTVVFKTNIVIGFFSCFYLHSN